MSALRDEAVRRSAEAGKPIFPRSLAARILDDWAKARSADIAKNRATRTLQNAEG